MSAVSPNVHVQTVHYVPENIGDLLVEFLDGIDPRTLERAALSRLSWGSDQTMVGEMLEVLKEMARGRALS